jgi:hypothetical protein
VPTATGAQLRAHLLAIRRTLDEREREEHLRLERLLRSRRAGRASAQIVSETKP